MSSLERRKLICSVTFHVVAITCVVWSLYILIDRTADEIKSGGYFSSYPGSAGPHCLIGCSVSPISQQWKFSFVDSCHNIEWFRKHYMKDTSSNLGTNFWFPFYYHLSLRMGLCPLFNSCHDATNINHSIWVGRAVQQKHTWAE